MGKPKTTTPEPTAAHNDLCDEFLGNMQGIISWTEKYMAECTYTKPKKNGPDETGSVKDGAKFIKNGKKLSAPFIMEQLTSPTDLSANVNGKLPIIKTS